jgi:hypothetical protein
MPSLGVIVPHSSSQPGGISPGHTTSLKTMIKTRLSILILNRTYPTKFTSRHVRLLAGGFVLPKSN